MAVPKLRFKGFSDEWKTGHLRNNFSSISTNSYSRSLLNYHTGDVKNIHYGDIHVKFKSHFKVTSENVPYINDDVKISYSEECYCRKGDLIFADASEDLNDIGKSIEIIDTNDEKILAGLHTVHLRSHGNEFATGFGGYLLKTNSLIRQIQKEAQGAKVLGISASKILGLTYCSPSLEEQQKIADFLTSVDEKIILLKKKKELLEQYKKGVMQKIFSQELRFKDEEGKDFPVWESKKFKDLAKILRGSSPRPIVKYITTDKEGVNWIKIGDIDKNTLSIKKTGQKITQAGATKSRYVQKGEIILSNSMSYGIPIILELDGYIHDGWFVIRNFEKNFTLNYLLQILSSSIVQKQYKALAAGGVVDNISSELVNAVVIDLPSKSEQQKIADFLTALDDKIALVDHQINKTEAWKKGLLQQMFV